MIVRAAHRLAALGVASTAVAVSLWGAAAPASAQTPSSAPQATTAASSSSEDGDCDYGDFCLYYNSKFRGSVWDTDSFDKNLRNNYFVSDGAGQDKRVANDSASYWNNSDFDVYVYKGKSYTGGYKVLPAQSYGTFTGSWKNNIESLDFDYGH